MTPAELGWTVYESPIGPLTLVADAVGLRELRFPGRGTPLDEARRDATLLHDALVQLQEYFGGDRTHFDLALRLDGSAFQRSVWEALRDIPFGATCSYGELAARIGRADRVRAVAAAVGRTPVPIIVPCHRVIGADGSLTGYGGGLQRKQALLDLEAATSGGSPPPPVWSGRQLSLLR